VKREGAVTHIDDAASGGSTELDGRRRQGDSPLRSAMARRDPDLPTQQLLRRNGGLGAQVQFM